MALIKCPECGGQVSTAAATCPSCGYPIAAKASAADADRLLLEVRPSWWRFFWHIVFFWLLVPPVVAWWRQRSEVLRVYGDRISVERGLLSKCHQEFFIRDIRSIDVDQSFLARLVNIGDITISTAATVEADEHLHGVPDPKGIRDLIVARRQGR